MPTLKTKLKEVAGGAAEELEVQINALYEAVKEKSKTKAKEIKEILAKVSMVLLRSFLLEARNSVLAQVNGHLGNR